ncbi:hypothetical protein QE152_g29229 [Popillia japonica]|uniref:Uncharacterized protein n=1 Tax=Popillia japonica TaxID=7064 RepID=A0AAW1JI42_POPJA
MEANNEATDFFKHPKVAEVIHKLIQRKPARRQQPTTKRRILKLNSGQQPTTKRRILKLNSDGTLFPGRLYRLQVNGSWAGGIYSEFEGNVVKIVFSNDGSWAGGIYSEFEGNVVKIVFSNDTTQIRIANTIFGKEDLQTFSPFTLKKGDELSLKYSGSHSNLAQTEAVQVEVHIEEHVDNAVQVEVHIEEHVDN